MCCLPADVACEGQVVIRLPLLPSFLLLLPIRAPALGQRLLTPLLLSLPLLQAVHRKQLSVCYATLQYLWGWNRAQHKPASRYSAHGISQMLQQLGLLPPLLLSLPLLQAQLDMGRHVSAALSLQSARPAPHFNKRNRANNSVHKLQQLQAGPGKTARMISSVSHSCKQCIQGNCQCAVQ
jgi:hypothetical protein